MRAGEKMCTFIPSDTRDDLMGVERIQLSRVLEQITAELRDASERAQNEGNAVMRFEACELEFAIEIEAKGKAGIEIWLAQLGGSLKRTEANTLKVKYVALTEPVAPGAIVAVVQDTGAGAVPPKTKRRGRKVEG